MKKFCDPQLFHDPPYSEENDSSLKAVGEQIAVVTKHIINLV